MGNGSSNAARNKLNARRAGKVGADLGGKYCDWISAELTRLMVIALSTTTSFANLGIFLANAGSAGGYCGDIVGDIENVMLR